MLFVHFKCKSCGHTFRKLGLFANSQSVSRCPVCGAERAPLTEQDKQLLELSEKRCSSYG